LKSKNLLVYSVPIFLIFVLCFSSVAFVNANTVYVEDSCSAFSPNWTKYGDHWSIASSGWAFEGATCFLFDYGGAAYDSVYRPSVAGGMDMKVQNDSDDYLWVHGVFYLQYRYSTSAAVCMDFSFNAGVGVFGFILAYDVLKLSWMGHEVVLCSVTYNVAYVCEAVFQFNSSGTGLSSWDGYVNGVLMGSTVDHEGATTRPDVLNYIGVGAQLCRVRVDDFVVSNYRFSYGGASGDDASGGGFGSGSSLVNFVVFFVVVGMPAWVFGAVGAKQGWGLQGLLFGGVIGLGAGVIVGIVPFWFVFLVAICLVLFLYSMMGRS